MIRNITGRIVAIGLNQESKGVFIGSGQWGGITGGGNYTHFSDFSAGRVVPTGVANKPRGWGALACCYLGTPAS